MNRPPLSNDTIDSVLQHREVGRAKDLSAPPRIIMPRLVKYLATFSSHYSFAESTLYGTVYEA